MLSVILPTFNEKEHLSELSARIQAALPGAEIIVVDDNSPDGTADFARHLGLKVLVRPVREGLASAVLEGFKIAKGDILCVMDADLSHSPEVLPEMLKQMKDADVVVGSRLIKGGGSLHWSWFKRIISNAARWPAYPLTRVKDPTSGFFMLKRTVLEGAKINPIGFKILLEILAKGKYRKAVEVPIIFAKRHEKGSKLGFYQITEYLVQLGLLYKDAVFKPKNKK